MLVSTDRAAPVVAVNICYGVGSRDEAAGRTGFAHLFEHVMFQGSRHVAKAEHFALVQSVGGRTNAATWVEGTNYEDLLPSHQLELALWLEADRLGTLLDALSPENLDNQRAVVKNERRARVDNVPYGSADERLHALAFPPDHPYHHSTFGSMADLEAATLDDVRRFFATFYAPNNASLAIVGDVDAGAAVTAVERYFGRIPANPAIPRPADLALAEPSPGEVRASVADDVPLGRIIVAHRAPVMRDARHPALEIAARILAGGTGSRLYRRLVRDERSAQDVDAELYAYADGASLFVVSADVDPDASIEQVEAALLDELRRIATEPVTEDELVRARALVETSELGALGQVRERAERLALYATLLDDPGRLARDLDAYALVSAEGLRALAAEVFDPRRRIVLAFLPDEE